MNQEIRLQAMLARLPLPDENPGESTTTAPGVKTTPEQEERIAAALKEAQARVQGRFKNGGRE